MFISSSVHQTKFKFKLSISFQAELEEVIIKFVEQPGLPLKVSTGRAVSGEGQMTIHLKAISLIHEAQENLISLSFFL
jgi:hypothetical protein